MSRNPRFALVLVSSFFLVASAAANPKAAPKSMVYVPAAPAAPVVSGEDYKSFHPENKFTAGISSGFGLVDTHGGFSLVGNLAAKVVKDGWIPEIVNPVFLEVEFGPTFVSSATFWMYSTHLRWDFVKDPNWTLFALGGFGGNFGSNRYGDRVALHPRFGVGAFYSLETVDLRFEFSHELITIGMSLPF